MQITCVRGTKEYGNTLQRQSRIYSCLCNGLEKQLINVHKVPYHVLANSSPVLQDRYSSTETAIEMM